MELLLDIGRILPPEGPLEGLVAPAERALLCRPLFRGLFNIPLYSLPSIPSMSTSPEALYISSRL